MTTAQLAYGIDYASRVQKADVISMSHGGSPSQLWVDVVNAAYGRGTPMIAAEGDFFSAFGTDLGVLVPSSPVFPAQFRRVLGVTGVTSNYSTYGKNSILRLAQHFFTVSKKDAWKTAFIDVDGIRSWLLRGSYGGDMSVHRPWSFTMEEQTDTAQDKLGSLHAHPVAGYAPNIGWLNALSNNSRVGDTYRTNLIDLDGAGTSSATPQVAAAAALWILKNHEALKNLPPSQRWKKAEAVYFALLKSANRPGNKPDHYLGAGMLKANDALDLRFEDIVSGRENIMDGNKKILIFPTQKHGAPGDRFDAQRDFWGMINLFQSWPPYEDRADLQQQIPQTTSREQALTQLYYNTYLMKAWHSRQMPKATKVNGRSNPQFINQKLWEKAKEAAKRAR